ncbi:MAG: DUF4435 domain-containing protein [Candidatus Sumerlaeia bacterium]|nr:DUF4435 domain-containing protein [Candidatus Sumerlaeia bacterium]
MKSTRPIRGEYSGRSYLLFNDYNDINLFVEDKGFENLYLEILRRSGTRVRKVFSRDGKKAVLKAAESCSDSKCVYLIDRDWDDALGIRYDLDRLIVLDRHSIENYFLEYGGFCGIVRASKPREDVEKVLSKDVFDEIVQEVSDALRPLFECFLTIQMEGSGEQNCSAMPGKFAEGKGGLGGPNCKAIQEFIADRGIRTLDAARHYFALADLRERGHGKFMIHFVWNSVRCAASLKQIGRDELLIRLAQLVDASVFDYLMREIGRCAEMRGHLREISTQLPAGSADS